MIIAAFAGTGKSYFAEHVAESKDFPIMPYKYMNLEKADISREEAEKSKADPDHELNPEWPDNYIRAVANLHHDYKYFIIPSDRLVLRGLQLLQIPYILVYPEREAKEEYRDRFQKRGNTDEFQNVFIGHWDGWMDRLRRDTYGWCIELPKGKYLIDIRDEIDRIIDREEVCLQIDIDSELLEAASKKLKERGLSPAEYLRRCLEWTVHHEAEAIKLFQEWKRKPSDNSIGTDNLGRLSGNPRPFNDRVVHA